MCVCVCVEGVYGWVCGGRGVSVGGWMMVCNKHMWNMCSHRSKHTCVMYLASGL